MGTSKTEIFSEKQNRMAQLAKCLSHPARIAIIEHLFNLNACVCGELVDVIGLAQPTISQHLKELKNAGLIQGTTEGTSVCYCIDPKGWEEMQSFLTSFASLNLKSDKDCC